MKPHHPSANGKVYFIPVAKRTTGIANINKSQLGDFPVPVPPVSRQALYAETIQRFRATTLAGNFVATSAAALTASLMSRLNRLLDDLAYPIWEAGDGQASGRPEHIVEILVQVGAEFAGLIWKPQ